MSANLPTDLESVRQVVEDRRRDATGQLRADLLNVLDTPQGRRLWLWVVYDVCGLNKRLPRGVPLERLEGRRDVACDLLDRLVLHPEVLAQLEQDRAGAAAEEAQFEMLMRRLAELEGEKHNHPNPERD